MPQRKSTRTNAQKKRKDKKRPKRRQMWKEWIGLVSLLWSVFRFLWEQVHRSR